MVFFLRAVLFLAIVLSGITACSSIPNFRPSKPVEEATSFKEAVEICAQYSIPVENDSAGQTKPLAIREVLIPWMRCMETTFRTQAGSRESEAYAIFYHELSKTHVHLPAKGEVVAVADMNVSVAAIFRSVLAGLESKKYSFTSVERKAIKNVLPSFSLYLDSIEVSLK